MKAISQREHHTTRTRQFAYTKIVLQDGQDFYSAQTQQRKLKNIKDIDVSALAVKPIPFENYCPVYQHEFTLAPSPTPKDCFEKRPPISESRGRHFLREIRTCEILKNHPHPNIAKYKGCLTEDGHITGICFTEYHQTLTDRIYHDPRPFDNHKCISDINRGLTHLHSLSLIHNDLNPSNIMLEKDDNAVIIDFDGSCNWGDTEGIRCTEGWYDANFNSNLATRQNDYSCLQKIREWLTNPEPFKYWHARDRKLHDIQGHHGQFPVGDCFICYTASHRMAMRKMKIAPIWPDGVIYSDR